MDNQELIRAILEALQQRTQEKAEQGIEALGQKMQGISPAGIASGQTPIAPSQLKNIVDDVSNWSKAIKSLTKVQTDLARVLGDNEKDIKKEKTLGRLPLASVPAALRGSQTAGARVGYALGGFTGLAAGVAGAGIIGAGFAASPNGADVILKPFAILAGTIGVTVLPALVHFGATLLDTADALNKYNIPGALDQFFAMFHSPIKTAKETYGAAAGAAQVADKIGSANFAKLLINTALGTNKPPPAEFPGYTPQQVIQAREFEKLDAEQAKRIGIPALPVQTILRNMFGERDQALADRQTAAPGARGRTHADNVRSIMRDMIDSMGVTPHYTGLADLQKEMQIRGLQGDLEQRQKEIFLEGIRRIEAGLEKVEGAVKGKP